MLAFVGVCIALECGTDEQLRNSVAMIRKGYENYKKLRDLQYLFIDDIQEPEKDILITRYEDGTVTVCNGSSGSYRYHGIAVNPLSLARLSPEERVTAVLNGTQVPERKSKAGV